MGKQPTVKHVTTYTEAAAGPRTIRSTCQPAETLEGQLAARLLWTFLASKPSQLF